MTLINKMDHTVADYYNVIEQMRNKLNANPIPIQIPIGSEESFTGVVDLINMNAIVWDEESLGAKYEIVEIPEELKERALEYRKLMRSEEHTSELQSRGHLVCRLLLEKKIQSM